ncbi:MAG: 30S ribosome-binding factor RbfA [Myxococcales bacterium]
MNQRTERLGSDIHAVLSEIIARGEIRDSRVRGVGLVTITRVRVTGDLSEARAAFTVFGASAETLEEVRRGLQAARAFLQQELGRRLRTRKTVMLSFEVDRALDNAFRVEGLLRADAARQASLAPPVVNTEDGSLDADSASPAEDRAEGNDESPGPAPSPRTSPTK